MTRRFPSLLIYATCAARQDFAAVAIDSTDRI
jgi:hypothetical protein